MAKFPLPSQASTTAIGSLPHHNIDAALEFAFRVSIPFLPQIPIRNPWEFMIAQALEGMPGLEIERDGSTSLNLDVWTGRTKAFNERLSLAYDRYDQTGAFAEFEPSGAASSSWQPFLWELNERKVGLAKLQLAGPLTSQWVLRLKDGSHTDKHPEISTQIFKLVLARSIAMCRRLSSVGIQPLFYLDEPGLYAVSPANPRHQLALQELKLMIQALKKEGVFVGLHCCSNTHWESIFALGVDVLSLDTHLSLSNVLEHGALVKQFVESGGRFSLGVVPTSREIHQWDAGQLLETVRGTFTTKLSGQDALIKRILRESIYTPACGLALHDPKDAETIVTVLLQFHDRVKNL